MTATADVCCGFQVQMLLVQGQIHQQGKLAFCHVDLCWEAQQAAGSGLFLDVIAQLSQTGNCVILFPALHVLLLSGVRDYRAADVTWQAR